MGYDTTKSSKSDTPFELLETDIYRMEIKKAEIAPNTFAEPDDAGNYPDQLLIVWECYEATPDQDDACVGRAVFQRMTPWYGTGRRGDSQFKVLIDSLNEQAESLGIEPIDPTDFDPLALVGIRQRVNVENYIKSMGKNKGDNGNRVVGKPMPIKRTTKAQVKPAAPARKNAPQAVDEEGEELF